MSDPVTSGEYFEHVTGPGERWDAIAFNYYNDASLSHLIIDANRQLFIDPLQAVPAILPSRTVLRVPVIEIEIISNDLLPPWKRK
jgi:hypothetical protein